MECPVSGKVHAYRENAGRCVFIQGRIDQQQVYRVAPEILKLRGASSDPLTVYIDSFGGDTFFADAIQSLLQAPNQDGQSCRIITVATGLAASAAADLLASGDYAIAYRDSYIHYHGTRQPTQGDLTAENAESVAKSMKQTNERFALRLARKSFRRCFFNYGNLAGEFETQRAILSSRQDTSDDTSDLACFARALSTRLSAQIAELPLRALKRQHAIRRLNERVIQKAEYKDGDTLSVTEVEVLKRVLDHKLEENAASEWLLSGGGLADVAEDFGLIIDYYFGEYRSYLAKLLPEFGDLLLNSAELEEWKVIQGKSPDERDTWLKSKVAPRLHPLWYFVVCLSRLLQQGEFGLTPRDAYWLGIVDEVIGTDDLPSPRLVLESQFSDSTEPDAGKPS